MSDEAAPAPTGDNLLEWAVREYLAAKIQRHHILNYNGAQLAWNHAQDVANRLNNGNKITPFPANFTNIQIEAPKEEELQSQPVAPVEKKPMSDLAKLLAAAVLGSGLTAGSMAVGNWIYGDDQPAPAVQQQDNEVGFSVR